MYKLQTLAISRTPIRGIFLMVTGKPPSACWHRKVRDSLDPPSRPALTLSYHYSFAKHLLPLSFTFPLTM